jgi:hypothetical protein
VRSRRTLAAAAFAALFVALVLVAAPHAASLRSRPVLHSSTGPNSVGAAESRLAPPSAVSAEQARRAFSSGTVLAFLAIGLGIAPARLLRRTGGAPVGSVRSNHAHRRRERAPPFARA